MFKNLGYKKEFYVNNKLLGTLQLAEKDRELTGYHGRREEQLTAEVILDSKKKIKAGTKVLTMLIEMSGNWQGEPLIKAHRNE